MRDIRTSVDGSGSTVGPEQPTVIAPPPTGTVTRPSASASIADDDLVGARRQRRCLARRRRWARSIPVGAPEIAATPIRVVIDVRERSEFAGGHVPGAIDIELGTSATAPPISHRHR